MFAVRPVVWHFIWWALLAPLLLLELRALDMAREQLALNDPRRAQTTLATVVDERINVTEPVIRYRFQLPGSVTWYSATDMIGRRELWTPVAPAVARRAAQEGSIQVRYLPENPWVNQPLGRAGNTVADGFAGWILFLLIDILWLGETFLIARNFLHCLVAAERQQPARMRFWRSVRS